jgi:signal peptidase I
MRFLTKRNRTGDRPPVQKSKVREWCESIAFTMIFVWLFTNHIAQATEVPTESMKPTILAGDHFFLDKVAFPANYPQAMQKYLPVRTIKRGDIIAFWSPENPDIRLVKRVIGLPNESIEIRQRTVYINGTKLDEPYKVHTDSNTYSTEIWVPRELQRRDNMATVTIPSGQYFMMGDNRDNSNDSRFWGFARREAFIGKPTFIYWSYEVDPYEPTQQSVGDLALHYASMAEHFFTKTRWFRTGEFLR